MPSHVSRAGSQFLLQLILGSCSRKEPRPPLLEAPCPPGAGTSGGPWQRGAGAGRRGGPRGRREALQPPPRRDCGAAGRGSRRVHLGGGPDGEARLSARPPARSPPARTSPARRARVARRARGPRFAAPLPPRSAASLCPGKAAGRGRPLHRWGGFSLRVRATPPSPRSEPGRCRRGVSAGARARAWAGGGRDARAGAPCLLPPAPPPRRLLSRKFVAPHPRLRTCVAAWPGLDLSPRGKLRLERRRRAGSQSAMEGTLHQGSVASWAPPEAISHPGERNLLCPVQPGRRGPGPATLGPCAEPGAPPRGAGRAPGLIWAFLPSERLFFLACITCSS